MKCNFLKTCSLVLILAILINLLPMQVLGADMRLALQDNIKNTATQQSEAGDAEIVGEAVDKRTQFSKEYILSNGMHMAVVYPEAVHYDDDGQWKDIDNTLEAVGSGTTGTYTNRAGAWKAIFPQQLNKNKQVSIEKDGYKVSFAMSGELRTTNVPVLQNELLSAGVLEAGAVQDAALSVVTVQNVAAQIQELDYTAMKESAEHPEVIRDKIKSRLKYSNVFNNTDIIYDMNSYQVKESIVIHNYNAAVRGYQYNLDTDGLVPILNSDNSIDLVDTATDEVVMSMPAPFMIDASGEISTEVQVSLVPNGDQYMLTYEMPMEWLADTERQWPVVLDPVVTALSDANNILDQTVTEISQEGYTSGASFVGYWTQRGKMRTFLQYVALPKLSSADVIVHAEISMFINNQNDGNPIGTDNVTTIEVRDVKDVWNSTSITWDNQPEYNQTIEDFAHVSNEGRHYWNVTDIARGWYDGTNTGMMFKATKAVEEGNANNWKKFYSIDYSIYATDWWPYLSIVFRNTNGLEDYWDYTAHGAGRAGIGYINNYSGNLVWIREDLGFGGNRMPVSISHIYNTNDKQSNNFGLGLGWRTNYNQTVEQWSKDSSYYIWEDGDGTKHYFKYDSGNDYLDEDGLGLTLTVTSSGYSVQDDYGNTSYFDSHGRLTKQENNQQTKSSIGITYTTSNGYLISQITDGVGRKYNFTYNSNDLLSKITYIGNGSTEISSVTYSYSGSLLTRITDKDGKSSIFSYTADNLLSGVQDVDGYRLAYTYTAGSPKRVASVSEYQGTGIGTPGGSLTISYGQNQTKFTDHNGNIQIAQFNDWGNTLSVQDGEGRAQYAQYALNDYSDAPNGTAKGNQLRLSSKMQNTVVNIVKDHSFENGSIWTPIDTSVSATVSSEEAFSGSKSLKVTPSSSGYMRGVKGEELDLLYGEIITFSAYVKTGSGVSVCLTVESEVCLFDASEYVLPNSDWTRLEVKYQHYDDEYPVYPQILCSGTGTLYLDCVQIEMESTASRYNLLENNDSWGGSSLDNCWTRSSAMTSSDNITTLSSSAYEKLDNTVFAITGDPSAEKYVSQTITQSGTAGDTYVLTGWGIGDATPENVNDTNARAFGLKVILNNTDGTKTESVAPFNSDLPADGNWQYTATGVVAEKAYSSITVQAVYSYHCNTVYFDGIQLFQERFGYQYDYNTAGYVEQVTDLQGGITSYSYNEETNDLTSVTQPDASVTTYGYDTKHNVTSTATEANVQYSLTYDDYGNTTSVTIINGNSKITSTSTYSDDGNRLESTTDALGKTTTYGYNENTNVLEWVQYPEDTAATRTNYAYDAMHRLATAAATTDTGSALTASYTYTNDMLTEIETGSTTYSFTYGAFAQRSSIKIGSRTLASYTYSNDQNCYLTQLDYGNGDYVQYTYDDQGRVVQERFEDGKSISYSYDSTGALESVYDSTVYRNTKYSYDLSGRLSKYTESDTGHSVGYTYDELSNVTQMEETIGGTIHTTVYAYDGGNRVNYIVNGNVEESTSYDAYGRLRGRTVYDVESWEITDGFTNVVTYDYTYTTGADTTVQSNYLKALTYETLWISGSVNYSYDDNGNISQYVSAWDGGSSTIGYVYDSANQLIRENNSGMGSTWVWTYDNAGNILSSKKYSYTTAADLSGLTPLESHTYTYGDEDWGDLLTAYDGTAITYDAIGNPLSDGTWTYTWEHGRQLKSMSNGSTTWNYTYSADGMRKSRTNGSTTYTYVYNGDQLTQMTKGSDTLYFTYGSTGPVSVTWNGTTYYYVVNAQGDVIGIMEHTGDLAVEYRYNAWGEVTYSGYEPELAQLNPLRYRGYVYDHETGLYYLQSRYYNPKLGRFLNADTLISTGQGFFGNNMFAYCLNNPVNCIDESGEGAVAVLTATAAAGGANAWNPIGWVLLGVAVVATVVVVGYTVYNVSTREKTRVLADVKVKQQSGKPYRLAYISNYGGLIKIGRKMSFTEALGALGISGAVNSVTKRYKYDIRHSSTAQRTLEHLGTGNWGIYADSQSAAKALAVVFGFSSPPEVHAPGMYGHYHGGYYNAKTGKYEHVFHIWFGGILNY